MKLLLNSTPAALWYDIIHDAEAKCDNHLKEEVESYLVFLLMRYTNKPELLKQIIASEYLQGVKLPYTHRQILFQDVGDKCLLFSGLFPHIAEKRLVKISYFINIGQTAYDAISVSHNDLYNLLANQFVSLMDILQSVRHYSREYPDLKPLQAYDLWNEAGSKRALSVLKTYSKGTPLSVPPKK